jgi:hypothetical protein
MYLHLIHEMINHEVQSSYWLRIVSKFQIIFLKLKDIYFLVDHIPKQSNLTEGTVNSLKKERIKFREHMFWSVK